MVHTETNVVAYSHDTRSLAKNIELAKAKLIDKLDWHFNGEDSVEAQVKKIEKERKLRAKETARLKRETKAQLKAENSEFKSDTCASSEAENKKSTETSKSWCGRKIAKVLIAFYYLI